jgi:hypothetical protein
MQVCDAAGNWNHFAALGGETDINATLTALCPDGISAVRLICKFTVDGFVKLDDVWISGLRPLRAQVPAEMRDKFERLILASKPVHSWAGLLVDYV